MLFTMNHSASTLRHVSGHDHGLTQGARHRHGNEDEAPLARRQVSPARPEARLRAEGSGRSGIDPRLSEAKVRVSEEKIFLSLRRRPGVPDMRFAWRGGGPGSPTRASRGGVEIVAQRQ
jgi:hypothetical protein